MSRTNPILQTERLSFRRLTPNDLDALAQFTADPEVMRYVGEGRTRSRDEMRAGLAKLIDAEARQGFGVWATIERATGTMVGRCGLALWDIEGRSETEVIYLFGRAHWGRGYATEAAAAIRDYGFKALLLPRLICMIYPENAASRRVAEKTGFQYERDVSFMGHTLDLFSIGRKRAD